MNGITQFFVIFSRVIALTLFATALLKVLHMFQMPISRVRGDTVVMVFTNREVLLLASMLEIGVATCVLTTRVPWRLAILTLYFCACATLYQLGLFAQGDPECQCFGAATDWMGAGKTTLIARTVLLLLWIYAVALLWLDRKALQARFGASSCKIITILFLILSFSTHPVGASVAVQGEYQYTSWNGRGGKTNQEKRDFSAVLDQTCVIVTTLLPTAGPRSLEGPCTNMLFVAQDVFCTSFRCRDADTSHVTFYPHDYASRLGNCRDSQMSWIFLMLRCQDFFPIGSATSGTRQLASPTTLAGDPFSLITEANYTLLESGDKIVLSCDIVVSAALRGNWLESPLLSPEFKPKMHLPSIKDDLDRWRVGVLCERIVFSGFTNGAGMRFPTRLQSHLFSPPSAKGEIPPQDKASPYAVVNIILSSIEFDSTNRVQFLPMRGATISVTEQRLSDRTAHVGGARYLTNELATFEITPSARSAFDGELQRARKEMTAGQVRRFFTALLIALALGGPVIIAYVFRGRDADRRARQTAYN